MTTEAKDVVKNDIALSPVDSSQIAAVGYDLATKRLAVQFKSNTSVVYHYPGVTLGQYEEFVKAESLGRHFRLHIKSLPFNKVAA